MLPSLTHSIRTNISRLFGPLGGVIGMTRALAKEFGGRGICVNAVCPGAYVIWMVLIDLYLYCTCAVLLCSFLFDNTPSFLYLNPSIYISNCLFIHQPSPINYFIWYPSQSHPHLYISHIPFRIHRVWHDEGSGLWKASSLHSPEEIRNRRRSRRYCVIRYTYVPILPSPHIYFCTISFSWLKTRLFPRIGEILSHWSCRRLHDW